MVVYLFRDSPPNLLLEMGGRRLELDRGDVAHVEGSPALNPTDDRGREQTRLPGRFADPAYSPSFTRLCTLFSATWRSMDGRHCGEIEG
jgi:hypothetical protein